MTPASFPQANRNLTAPADMTREECGDLPTFTDGRHCISLWALSWRERLRVLLTGRVWLWVWSGQTQPPVALGVDEPFVLHDKPRKAAAIMALFALLLAACGGNPAPRPPAPTPSAVATQAPGITLCHYEPQELGHLWQSLDLTAEQASEHSDHPADHPGSCTGGERPPRPPRPEPPKEPCDPDLTPEKAGMAGTPCDPDSPRPDDLTVICHVAEDWTEKTRRIAEGAPDRWGTARWHIDQHKRDYRGECGRKHREGET